MQHPEKALQFQKSGVFQISYCDIFRILPLQRSSVQIFENVEFCRCDNGSTGWWGSGLEHTVCLGEVGWEWSVLNWLLIFYLGKTTVIKWGDLIWGPDIGEEVDKRRSRRKRRYRGKRKWKGVWQLKERRGCGVGGESGKKRRWDKRKWKTDK